MDLLQLKQQIMKKELSPFYIFTGEEVAIMNIYIEKIGTAVGKLQRVDSLQSIFGKLTATSILDQPTCYVIRDDKDFLQQEKLWFDLFRGNLQGNNVLIFIYTQLDKRGKFYKANQADLTEFNKLAPEVLAKYIKKEIGLDPPESVNFAEMCNNDYSRILLECDKIYHLSKAKNISIRDAFLLAIEEKVIYTYANEVIFELIDAICRRQGVKSFRLLRELQETESSPLGVLSLLYSNFRSMLLVRSAGDSDISNRTGLTGWQIKLAKEKGTQYNLDELVSALRTIRETEKGVKTGLIDSNIAIEYVLVNVL